MGRPHLALNDRRSAGGDAWRREKENAMWKAVQEIVEEFKRAETAGATMSAVAMGYICLDMMAFFSMPDGKEQQTRADFIAFVDTHLKAHKDQSYQYRGIDVYAARCAVLHRYGSEASLHQKDPTIKKFGYGGGGGRHFFNPEVSSNLVIIGTASLLNDIAIAVSDFLDACRADSALRRRAEHRLPHVITVFPHPK
jgi:hypothetical protein